MSLRKKDSGVPDKVKYFREINSSEGRSRSRFEFVIPIRDELRKEQNLI